MASVGEDFPREQARLRQLIQDYRELPGGVGRLGALMIEQTLQEADQAHASGDIVAILRAYAAMRECQ